MDGFYSYGQINFENLEFYGLNDSLVELAEFINETGPYDGVVGFS